MPCVVGARKQRRPRRVARQARRRGCAPTAALHARERRDEDKQLQRAKKGHEAPRGVGAIANTPERWDEGERTVPDAAQVSHVVS